MRWFTVIDHGHSTDNTANCSRRNIANYFTEACIEGLFVLEGAGMLERVKVKVVLGKWPSGRTQSGGRTGQSQTVTPGVLSLSCAVCNVKNCRAEE